MKIISIAAMRELEAQAMAAGISGFRLMDSAGRAAAAEIAAMFRQHPGVNRIAIVTGKGNNAGDGLVVAAALPPDIPVTIHAAAPLHSLRGDAAAHAARVPRRIPVLESDTPPEFPPDTLIVDALLGTGFTGNPREPLAGFIRAVNASGCPVVALDLPSGLDGDSGRAGREAVHADLTITFGLPKSGLFRNDGPRLCGSLRLGEIGLPRELLAKVPGDGEAFFAADARAFLPRLPYDSHKNTRGRLLLAAGSAAYPGAATLSARAALRGGAGFVRLATPVPPEGPLPAALVRHRLTAAPDGGFGVAAAAELDDLLTVSDAVAAGPGWSRGTERQLFLERLLSSQLPLVLDADALNTLAEQPTIGADMKFEELANCAVDAYAELLSAAPEKEACRLYDKLDHHQLGDQALAELRGELPQRQDMDNERLPLDYSSQFPNIWARMTARSPEICAWEEKLDYFIPLRDVVYAAVYRDSSCMEYRFLDTPRNIANFIGSHPAADQIVLTDTLDRLVLDTRGSYIHTCPDREMLAKVMHFLLPIQHGEVPPEPVPCECLTKHQEETHGDMIVTPAY